MRIKENSILYSNYKVTLGLIPESWGVGLAANHLNGYSEFFPNFSLKVCLGGVTVRTVVPTPGGHFSWNGGC